MIILRNYFANLFTIVQMIMLLEQTIKALKVLKSFVVLNYYWLFEVLLTIWYCCVNNNVFKTTFYLKICPKSIKKHIYNFIRKSRLKMKMLISSEDMSRVSRKEQVTVTRLSVVFKVCIVFYTMKLISVRNKLNKQIAIYVYLSSDTVFNINL